MFHPSPYQKAIFDYMAVPGGDLQISAVAGSGKCLGIDTPVLLFSGAVVPVQEVRPGDLLMGPDSCARQVRTTRAGIGPLFRIVPTKGTPWVCNDAHMLTLAGTNRFKGQTIDIPLDEYLRRCWSERSFRSSWKLCRSGVEFPTSGILAVDPYFVGLWIGDGTTAELRFSTVEPEVIEYLTEFAPGFGGQAVVRQDRTCIDVRIRRAIDETGKDGRGSPFFLRRFVLDKCRDQRGDKTIPTEYLTACRPDRLLLLAGLIDTDGYLSQSSLQFSTKHRHVADQVAFLCRSLGLAAYITPKVVRLASMAAPKTYYTLSISGDLSVIPCRVPRRKAAPRQQIKDVMVTGFSVEPLGEGKYYGFTLDGDGRFLLGDFTVTHNTTSLIELLNRQPAEVLSSTLLCAFNKEIARQLEDRAPRGTVVKTNHAVGFGSIAQHFGAQGSKWQGQIEDRKYRKLIDAYWIGRHRSPYEKQSEAEKELFKLLHFVRVTLTNPGDQEAVLAMAVERELELPELQAMLDAVPVILSWGIKGMPEKDKDGRTYAAAQVIDFDDMIWLPHVLSLQPKRFKLILVDECQDLNAAQLDMLLKCRLPGGRMVFVGDENQAVYGFAGADYRSFRNITERTQAQQLPLSVCYRCPKAVIDLAKEIVPQIEAAPNAAQGAVQNIKEETFLAEVTRRDMVLCRVNAPLLATCFRLIQSGKPAKVRGRDIGAQLTKIVDAVEKFDGYMRQDIGKDGKLRTDEQFSDFGLFVERWRSQQLNLLASRKDAEMLIAGVNDRADSVLAVYAAVVGDGGSGAGAVRAAIQDLFADDERGVILLSSIHKAKGLEAERVFILCPEKMPHPMASTEAQQVQEHNLRYVAYTRAMRELFLVETDKERESRGR